MVFSNGNNPALTNINDKFLEIMNDRGKLASSLLSPVHKITNPEQAGQVKPEKDPDSNNVKDFSMSKTIHVTLYNNLLTFRDTYKWIELKDNFSKMIENENYNVAYANLSHKK